MEKPTEEEPLISTLQLQKTLNAFIKETRDNFSSLNSDRENDNELMQTTNRNVAELQGQVQNLSNQVKSMTNTVKNDTQKVADTVEDKVDELREEIAPKKIIIKEIKHFDLGLFFKTLLRRK